MCVPGVYMVCAPGVYMVAQVCYDQLHLSLNAAFLRMVVIAMFFCTKCLYNDPAN